MNAITIVLFSVALLSAKSTIEEIDFSNFFKGHEGTMVIYDSVKDRYFIYNIDRSKKRFSPFSTFKIANSVVAFETGVIDATETEFQWDTIKYPNEEWWPKQWLGKHTMRSAIKYSVVPFYREISARVGKKRMQALLNKYEYGNRDMSSGEDNFWLNGSLSISAMEQIGFLRRFYNNKFDASPKTIDAVKDILIQEDKKQYTLSAKTGAGTGFDKASPERALGWYVGYVEKDRNVYYFAMNVEGESFNEIIVPRKEITMGALKKLNVVK